MAVVYTWHPAVCPSKPHCAFEFEGSTDNVTRVARLCSYHLGLIGEGIPEQEVVQVVRDTGRALEAARYAAKMELGLDKEFPGLPFTVDANGNARVRVGRWAQDADGRWQESPASVSDKNRARAAANAAMARVQNRHARTASVEVE